MDYNIKGLFNQLKQEKWETQKYGRRINSTSGIDMFLAIWEGKPAFRFVSNLAFKQRIQSIKPRNGFEISFDDGNPDSGNIACFIFPRSKENVDLFLLFISDLAQVAGESDSKEATQVLIERLAQWATFFDKCPSGILSNKEQIGLFGELHFLQIYLEKDLHEIVNYWVGPEAATKDFVFVSLAVEVKTTARNDNNRIYISDENQLDDTGFDSLILCNLIVSEDSFDGYTLPELIEYIRKLLVNHDNELSRFNILLEKAGYKDVFADLYDKSFSLSCIFYFSVNKDFPRIIPCDLKKGVKSVSYSIERSLCMKNIMEYSIAEDLICSSII